MPWWKRIAREPLVHFVALGGLLFVVFAWRGGGGASRRIVVTPGRIEHLSAGFTRTWQRPPSNDELKGLLDDFVREEIAVREAAAMGLDADDTIIRRRLRQKLEFLVEDAAAATVPTDQELEAWLDAHAGDYRTEPRVSFDQVYVSRDRRGEAADDEARALLERLRTRPLDAATDQLGDPLMVPPAMLAAPRSEIARVFGDAFADAVIAIEPGGWTGPIESGYGPHLVLVKERVDGAVPDLPAVRPQVERDLLAARRKAQLDELYTGLLEKYDVVIEWGQEDGGGA